MRGLIRTLRQSRSGQPKTGSWRGRVMLPLAFVALLGLGIAALNQLTGAVQAASTPALSPVADGTYSQWTPSTDTSHWNRVNEPSCSPSDSSNVNSASNGQRDSYLVSPGGLLSPSSGPQAVPTGS